MSTLGFHLVLRLGDDRVIAPSRAQRRLWARRLCALSRTFPILAWKLADTHLHLLLVGDAATAVELVRRLRIWVSTALQPGVPLELQRRKPLAGQSHIEAAFHYVLRQDDHHGVETDTHQDCSAVLDILGLRVLTPESPARVREHLPRLTRDALLRHLGVAELCEVVHLEHLAQAAAAAFGLDSLSQNVLSFRARRAAVAAAAAAGSSAIARALGITPQAACRLARADVPAHEIRAVRLQMALRAVRHSNIAFLPDSPAPLSAG